MSRPRKYASAEQLDALHDCLDKCKTETRVSIGKLDERTKSIKETNGKIFDKLSNIERVIAEDHVRDEYRDKAIAASKAKPNLFDKGLTFLRERVLLSLAIIAVLSAGGWNIDEITAFLKAVIGG